MPAQTDIVKQETFAPILYLLDYETLDEAIRIHNAVPQGLSSAIFTDSLRQAEAFLSTRDRTAVLPSQHRHVGRVRSAARSAVRRNRRWTESGSDAWKAYMRRQTTTIIGPRIYLWRRGLSFGA